MSKKNKIKEMRALSVIQPWAHCIVKKGKSVENRIWSTERRGYFLIHASKSVNKESFEYCGENYSLNLSPENVAFSSIVGIVKLTDVVTKRTVERKDKKKVPR